MKASKNDNPPLVAETRTEKFLAVIIEEQRGIRKSLATLNTAVQVMLLIVLAFIALTICNALNII